jgi:hypothetical protein
MNIKMLDNRAVAQYKKPEITKVALRPEEALVQGCKTPSVAGPNKSSCPACSAQGS